MKLMIVESPNKIKKIKGFLPPGWVVEASMGHIRDLPKDGGLQVSITPEGRVIPSYQTTPDKARTVSRLRELAAQAEEIVLATDPDREGEAIAWHLSQAIGRHRYSRATFHEITAAAISHAINNTRPIDQHLVDAQQARRVLDRVVGWMVSPTCSAGTGMRGAKSAGRVQSAALRIIAEREQAIKEFVPTPFYVVKAHVEVPGVPPSFWTKLVQIRRGNAMADVHPGLTSKLESEQIQSKIRDTSWTVMRCEVKPTAVNPFPPFTTSTITQAASSMLRWRPDKTMKVLQSLFEDGLITYHRTDSTNLSAEAVAMARSYIQQQFPPDYLPSRPNVFATKSANAQEAHEAIRPTHAETGADGGGDGDGGFLYKIIWQRFIACQMSAGKDDRSVIDVAAGPAQTPHAVFRATGSVVVFDGWRILMAAAQEDESAKAKRKRGQHVDDEDKDDDEESVLPRTQAGKALRYKDCKVIVSETKPPPRYTQASLIKELEKRGIGRPSTFASIVTKIMEREYIAEERMKLGATDTGMALARFLVRAYEGDFIDLAYTARMEEDLDRIARGEIPWEPMVVTASTALLTKASAAGYRYKTLAEVCADDGSVPRQAREIKQYEVPQRLSPCRMCGANIGWAQDPSRPKPDGSPGWVPINADGMTHVCQGGGQRPAASGGYKPHTKKSFRRGRR